ncbi:hypothetical protein HD597_004078 [Nonomuraea thailandensis]|uniref:Uncharacterized protein n=1 Tax=Nonomuraea thailandensis TaxID=1188745 RepID=A0A9X2GML4_9ACTN|nr:hypothetical protein [Nonomuraea thailandensis]
MTASGTRDQAMPIRRKRQGTVESGTWTTVHLYSDSNVTSASYSSRGSAGHTTMTHPRLTPAYSTCKWSGLRGSAFMTCKYRT